MPVKLARDIMDGVLDLVYPPYCLVCGEAGEHYLCPKCEERIDLIEPPYCRKCGIPTQSYFCMDCLSREFAFECATSVGTYDGVLRDAIHALKYDCQIVLAEPLGEIMTRAFAGKHLAGKVQLAIPIPVHRSKLLERGFNQAEEIARRFCERVSIPLVHDVLVKTRNTGNQVDLPLDARMANLIGAFGVRRPEEVWGKNILLLDDVMTTGSTLHEAAATLRVAGSGLVYAYTLARSV